MKKWFCFIAVAVAILTIDNDAFAQFGDFGDKTPVAFSLESNVKEIAAGESFAVIARFVPKEHWHVYWKSPGDAGMPTEIVWTVPDGFEIGKISWPPPETLTTDMGPTMPPMVNFGYNGEFALVQIFTAPVDLKPGKRYEITGDASWQACNESCLLGRGSVTITIVGATRTKYRSQMNATVKKLVAQAPMTSDVWNVKTTVTGDILTLTPVGGDVSSIKKLTFMPFDGIKTVNLGAGQIWKNGTLTLTLQKERKTNRVSGIVVRQTPWAKNGSRALVVNGDDKIKLVKKVERKRVVPTTAKNNSLVDAGHGFVFLDADVNDLPFEFVVGHGEKEDNGTLTILKYVLFAFLGGMILNIMPCVLPVLSIKAMSIVNSAHKDHKQIFRGSMAYTLGIMISFLVLATLVAIAKVAGQQAGWGDQMQSPQFVVVLFVIIWVFALSLFDVFIIQLPGMQAANKASTANGHLGSFLSGVFAVLLSTPCTAPLLGSAIGFLFTQSIPIVYVSFMAIGLGLASPFILLGLTPKMIKWIPKPGNWMNVFREIMGFLLIGTAIFLAYVLQSQLGEHFFSFLIFVLPLSFACWLYGKAAGPGVNVNRQIIVFMLTMGIVALSARLLIKIPAVDRSNANNTAELMRKALVDDKRMVFLDFGAKWCTTCKAYESTVIYSDSVMNEFKKKNVLLLKGDFTNRDPKINDWLNRFARAGVPLYVIIRPGTTITAEVLPDMITKQKIIDELNE